jgi:L-asparagine transporter-like permease
MKYYPIIEQKLFSLKKMITKTEFTNSLIKLIKVVALMVEFVLLVVFTQKDANKKSDKIHISLH